MKVAVKTLTGNKFEIEAELSTTIGECKKIVEADKGFPAAGMKLICDGKVLKDDVTLEAAGIKPGSFLVCFVSKKAKKKKPAPAPTPQVTMTGDGSGSTNTTTTSSSNTNTTAPPATTNTTAPPPTTTENAEATTTNAEPTSTSSDATATTQNTTGATTIPQQPAVDAGVVQQVMEITNTDEATATAAVRAAFGDVSRAVAYVFDPSSMPQMPPPQQAQQAQQGGTTATTGGDGGGTNAALDQLRNDPRFDQLRTMVQQNPASLPAVLRGIETTNPQLFAIINQDPPAFVRMLNEPIQPRAGATTTANTQPTQGQAQPTQGGLPGMAGLAGALGGLGNTPNPAQLVQMLNAMPPQARAQMAQQLGMTPEQLQQFQQMMAQMPPGQLQQMMQQMGGMGGGGGGGGQGGQGGLPPGAVRVNLSPDDQAAIQRLEAMGLGSRNEIIQVYLACDRNENQAANILMDQAFQ